MNLRACLEQCSLALLRQIAEHHAVPLPEVAARAEVIRLLLGRLLAPGYLGGFVGQLDDAERWPLELVAAAGGQLRGFVFERRLRRRLETAGIPPDEVSAPTQQLQSGLLFRTFQATGSDRGEVYALPAEPARSRSFH